MTKGKLQCLHQAKCLDSLCPHREKHEEFLGKLNKKGESGVNSCLAKCSNGKQFKEGLTCQAPKQKKH